MKDIEQWIKDIEDDHDFTEIAREENIKLLEAELGIRFVLRD